MRWSRLPGSTEPGESCTGEGHRAQGIAVLRPGKLLSWMGRSSRPCEEAWGSCVKKEFHTAVTLPGHLPHSPPHVEAVRSPEMPTSQSRESESISSIPGVFFLDPGVTVAPPQVIYLTFEPLSSLTASPWTILNYSEFPSLTSASHSSSQSLISSFYLGPNCSSSGSGMRPMTLWPPSLIMTACSSFS